MKPNYSSPNSPEVYADEVSRLPPDSQLDKAYIPPLVQKAMKEIPLERAYKNAASNFYWIAALSLINSLVSMFGGGIYFVIGLGITQLIDGVAYLIVHDIPNLNTIAYVIAFVLNLSICGVIALLGLLTAKGYHWALLTGMVLYAMDALLVLIFKDWLGFAFHLFFLWQIWMMLRLIKYWKKVRQDAIPKTPQNFIEI